MGNDLNGNGRRTGEPYPSDEPRGFAARQEARMNEINAKLDYLIAAINAQQDDEDAARDEGRARWLAAHADRRLRGE